MYAWWLRRILGDTHSFNCHKQGSVPLFDDFRLLELAIVDSRNPQCLLGVLSGHSAELMVISGCDREGLSQLTIGID